MNDCKLAGCEAAYARMLPAAYTDDGVAVIWPGRRSPNRMRGK